MKNNNNLRAWILVIGVLGILTLAVVVILSMLQAGTQRVLQPVTDLSNSVGTQVTQLLHPTPTIIPDPLTIINQVRSLARLETIQYTVEKVITAETGQGVFAPLFGDRLLLVAHGFVLAGIDMEKLGPEDLWVEQGILYVHLPETEIFVATLDNDNSYIYDRETGLFTQGDANLETLARQAAEDEIRNAALADGILDQAQTNAEAYLYRLFRSLGFVDVIFVDPIPTP
jgi:hypothetical protein